MPLDGIVIADIKNDIKKLINCRIDKIYQPENDEIILSIRGFGENLKLLMTASSQNPRIHFTEIAKENPKTPPLFCMVLRKHLSNGKITDVIQPGFERIVEIHIESLDEMGDLSVKRLIIEIMGKHSNIILVDGKENIIDAVKHVSFDKSSVRQVLPGRPYFYPPNQDKLNPMALEKEVFTETINSKPSMKVQEAIYKSYSGISPVMASDICMRAQVDPSKVITLCSVSETEKLFYAFESSVKAVLDGNFLHHIYGEKETGNVIDFYSLPLHVYESSIVKPFENVSKLIESFYRDKDVLYRTKQKTQDLRKLVQNHIDRLVKKKEIQIKTLKEIENRDFHKICGELITANIYSIQQGLKTFNTVNFYEEDLPEITIALDPDLTPSENAQKYFKKYNKAKRTFTAMKEQQKETEEELYYLDSVMSVLEGKLDETDIRQIRDELTEEGYIKKHKDNAKKQNTKKMSFMQFVSSDGYEIYVGKNNKQNDELTLKFASNYDLWLHTKNIPGSHVIIKSQGVEIPDTTIEEAANLAAYFSKGKESSMVPVDYTLKKNVKKPSSAKPGMVIYETYKTAYITPDKEMIDKVNKHNLII